MTFLVNKLKCSLIFLIAGYSIVSLGFSPDSHENGRPSFVQLFEEALDENHVSRLESLLNNPPPGRPLSESDGRLVYGLFNLLFSQEEASDAQRVLAIARKAFQLGANPKSFVPMRKKDGKIVASHMTGVEAILDQWSRLADQHPDQKTEIASRASHFFDELLSFGGITPDDWVRLYFADGSSRRFRLLHYPFVMSATRDIYSYFLSKRPSIYSLDDLGMNTPMVIAAVADLEALKAFAEAYGPIAAAEAFNFRTEMNFNPTVLHVAVNAINMGKSVGEVSAVISYLVENGADPDQRSMYHDLIDETNFWARQAPRRASEFRQLGRQLKVILPELRTSFSLAKLKCEEFLKDQQSLKKSDDGR